MAVKAVKKLIRDSRRKALGRGSFQVTFPLIALSPQMAALINNVTRLAKQGYFVILTGHHGDLIESPALFAEAACRLELQDYMEIPGSQEGVLYATDWMEGLFFPNAEVMPEDAQRFLADKLGGYLRFVLLCLPRREDIDPKTRFLPCMLERCDGTTLSWPCWQDRFDDHLPLVLAAQRFLEKQQQCHLEFDSETEQFLCCNRWESTAHLIDAVMRAAKNHELKPGISTKLTMEDFLRSKRN